jgi:hypothetical protein
VRAVIDIGALHARAVLMDERAKVLGYRMTSQCASGSGQFLENICRYLGVTIDEIGPLSLQADARAVLVDLRRAGRDRRHQHGLARHLDPEHPEGHPPVDGGPLREAARLGGREGRRAGDGRPRGGRGAARSAAMQAKEGDPSRAACASAVGPRRRDRRGAVGRLPQAQARASARGWRARRDERAA